MLVLRSTACSTEESPSPGNRTSSRNEHAVNESEQAFKVACPGSPFFVCDAVWHAVLSSKRSIDPCLRSHIAALAFPMPERNARTCLSSIRLKQLLKCAAYILAR